MSVCGTTTCREAIDMLAERFRDGIMPASFKDDLRRELIKVVKRSYLVLHFPNTNDCCVLLAYCGDQTGLGGDTCRWPREHGTGTIKRFGRRARS